MSNQPFHGFQSGGRSASLWDCEIQHGGRIYSYPDGRWISLSDDNYAAMYINQSESAGVGVDPIYEWNNVGDLIKAGQTIVGIDLAMRTNDPTNSSDLELLFSFIYPDPPSRALSGWDNNAEISNITLYRGSWKAPTDPEHQDLTGVVNDYHRRAYELNFVAPHDGWFTMFAKPTRGTSSTATDYYYYNSMRRMKSLNA